MREFYFYGLDFTKDVDERYKDRPYILGLTASPIKNKIKQADRLEFKFEMMDQMKDLCSNLNSKMVSVDMSLVDQNLIKNQEIEFIEFEVDQYWDSIKFIKDPSLRIPNIKSIIEE